MNLYCILYHHQVSVWDSLLLQCLAVWLISATNSTPSAHVELTAHVDQLVFVKTALLIHLAKQNEAHVANKHTCLFNRVI